MEREPADIVAEIEGRARRVDTPCGEGTMAWHIWGEGEPLVVSHGAQGAWSHWIANIDELAKTRMVVAADLPGHGDSALPETPDHAGISKAIATGLRQIVGERPIDFAGFSFGGVAFAWFAAAYPELVRRLVLIGCGGLDTPHGAVHLKPAKGLVGEERQAVLKGNLLGLMLHHPDSADELAQFLLVKNGRATRMMQAPTFVMPDRLAYILPRVSARVDAIWGEFDRPHPDPALQEAVIRRSHPECDFRVIEGAGHWAMYEQPEAFNAALLGILEERP
jgi:pimeloyl-ACP methyl ester carboxylesterase